MDVTSLKKEKFEIISYSAPPPTLGSTFSNVIKSFPSRKLIVIKVMEKLKDEDFKRQKQIHYLFYVKQYVE